MKDRDLSEIHFDEVEVAIEEYKRGRFVIIVDDEDRENEGDLTIAAEKVTPEAVNTMSREARGLICVPMEASRLEELDIPTMVRNNTSPFQTAFTISVDARVGVTTGISAYDRAHTIRVLADPESSKEDLSRPGHIFPLAAMEGGVLRRTGQTEAAVDLARMAGLHPSAVICEIMNEDGTMARVPQLLAFKEKHGITMISVASLIEFRMKTELLVEVVAETILPTHFGEFEMKAFHSIIDGNVHVALIKGRVDAGEPVLVRVHSSCFTGDVLGSCRCDCGDQLHSAMRMLDEEGVGAIVYMQQEGRGIGLVNKLRAYQLQDHGLDTVEANERLGFPADLRDYGIGAQILRSLGIRKLRLLTNNMRKYIGLRGYGLEVVERIPLEMTPCKSNLTYLRTKRDKLGHLLSKVSEEKQNEDD